MIRTDVDQVGAVAATYAEARYDIVAKPALKDDRIAARQRIEPIVADAAIKSVVAAAAEELIVAGALRGGASQ